MTDEATGTEFDTDLSSSVTRTTRGRKRANGGGRRVTQVTKREFVEDPDDTELEDLPGLFDRGDIEEHSIARIRIYRKDPHEGMVGYLDDPNASEDEIKERWGGSTYRCEGLNNHGKTMKVTTVTIAGDPIFVSENARRKWERANGIYSSASGAGESMSLKETLALMQSMDDKRRQTEDDRRRAEAEERRSHEERMRRMELEQEERRRREEREFAEARRKDEIEREERRRKDEAEREERRRREAAENDARQRAHLDAMMAMMRQSAEQSIAAVKQNAGNGSIMETIKLVVAIKEAFGGDTGGTEEGPLELLIKHGPEWLNGLGTTIGGAIREVKGGGVQPAQPQLAPVPGQPGQTPDAIVIPKSSPVATRLEKFAGSVAARGGDAAATLAALLDQAQAQIDTVPVPAKPAAAAAPAPATPPTTPEAKVQPQKPVQGEIVTPHATPAAKAKIISEKTTSGATRISFGA